MDKMTLLWDWADKAGIVIGLVSFIITISIRLLLSRQEQNRNTRIQIYLVGDHARYRVKPTILRKDINRSEIFGFIGSLPRYDATKRFSNAYLSSEQFWQQLGDIQSNKSTKLEIRCSQNELAQFDLEQDIFERKQAVATKPTTYLVSRHQATEIWMQRNGYHFDERMNHLNFEKLQQGDVLIGTLPITLIAKLNKMGIRYLNFSLDVPEDKRGAELSYEQLHPLNPRVEEFNAQRIFDNNDQLAVTNK